MEYEYIGKVPEKAPELPEDATYVAGAEVLVSAVPTVDGYKFVGWTTEDVTVANGAFEMPHRDVLLKGYFEKAVTSVQIRPGKTTLYVGDDVDLVVFVIPEDAEDKEVIYSSSDPDVATVTPEGKVEAYRPGKTTITVTSKYDPTKNTSVEITVIEDTTEPEKPEGTEYYIDAPKEIEIYSGQVGSLGVKVYPAEGAPALKYTSADESIVRVDENGVFTGVAEGETTVRVELPNGQFAIINVIVYGIYDTSNYIVFGKTEKIGWYSVSMDGGQTFMTVFGNSNLVVPRGTVLLIRANDVFGDPFKFFVNGQAVYPDENGYVEVVVEGAMVIGGLGTPVEAPDTEESLNLIQRIIKAIKDFFSKIFGKK